MLANFVLLLAALLHPNLPVARRANHMSLERLQPAVMASSSADSQLDAAAAIAATLAEVDDRDALALHARLSLRAAEDDDFGMALREGLDVCAQAVRLYGPAGVITSFNGGKDAVAILHLMRAALASYCDKAELPQAQLPVLFFEQADEFPEVDAFVREAVERYDLKMYAYSNLSFAPGLAKCMDESGAGAFVLGTRETDPNAKEQGTFAPSSDWMPAFMRVNPVLHWRCVFFVH